MPAKIGYGVSEMAEKANHVAMRKTLEVVEEFKDAGILFVPIPVINNEDGNALVVESLRRLDLFVKDAESKGEA